MGSLQKNGNGALLMHICYTADMSANGHLMSDCCCDCTPPLQRQYTCNVTSTNPFHSGLADCQRYVSQSPITLDYNLLGGSTSCRWQSDDISSYPASAIPWQVVRLIWTIGTGKWTVQFDAACNPGVSCTVCPQSMFVPAGPWTLNAAGSDTDHCEPRNSYTITVNTNIPANPTTLLTATIS